MENSEKKFKVCRNCQNWMVTFENPYEGVCTSQNSLAPTAETVEAQFTCGLWEEVKSYEAQL